MGDRRASFVDETLIYTNKHLSQFAGADLNPYAIHFARLMLEDYKLSIQAQRIYNRALNNLPAYSTPDDNLQFGWSSYSLIKMGVIHSLSYEHRMLCSAMTECFSEEYTAAVLAALGKECEALVETSPHVSQFRAVAHHCNGILSATGFGVICDDRMRLNQHSAAYDRPHDDSEPLPSPKDFAKALRSLADVVNGRQKDATLVGGDFVGWFAATAEFLLGLTVSVVDAHGRQLYPDQEVSDAQFKVVFAPQETPDVSALDASFARVLRLQPSSSPAPAPDLVTLPATGRVEWQSMLAKVFGRSFHRLCHTEVKTLGEALGGAARIIEFLTVTDDTTETQMLSGKDKANPASYGMGLVETISNWFPELRRLQGRMERAQKLDRQQANALCLCAISRLEELCGCDICSTKDPKLPHAGPLSGFCLPVMMETILSLALSLSRIMVAPHLYPSRAGIIAIYHNQCTKRVEAKKFAKMSPPRLEVLYGDEWNASSPRRLQTCATIFTGCWPVSDVPSNLVALSHESVCVYVLRLQAGDAEPVVANDHIIRVVSGGIGWKQKMFHRVCVGHPGGSAGLDWEEIRCSHFSEPLFFKRCGD